MHETLLNAKDEKKLRQRTEKKMLNSQKDGYKKWQGKGKVQNLKYDSINNFQINP